MQPVPDQCYICGQTSGLQKHHVWGAANRGKSEADGLYVALCMGCHAALHDRGICYRELRAEGQRKWMIYYSKRPEDFRQRYGKVEA